MSGASPISGPNSPVKPVIAPTDALDSTVQEPTIAKKEKAVGTTFPQARVKSIMKLDKDVQSTTAEAVFAVAVATELFLELLTSEAFDYAKRDHRRSLNYSDVALAVNDVQEFEFLTEIVPHMITVKEAMHRRRTLEAMRPIGGSGSTATPIDTDQSSKIKSDMSQENDADSTSLAEEDEKRDEEETGNLK
ncbi:hypothetical protein BATDEDRAFT_88393 [Batrachochytrium dendrobatidis JAM81]|uniref:Transcription factor CBF/NF-Y/archaeal histone domain-containing protein n=2 Tax=Batrachochytrium dendrobatidis TaxID=109871 RepID=F4P1B2_BATDJ|nr:uncharacterized protein BATDEDRAFT_88393 [Batrachochytrium dendrobatidis JAM81]EGF80712.1 hypothetical protein BATDEDRAFT_88393 [Batrachochytrium dendrobatidis JAM81]KAJ8328895.1 hypothetical protein O5D80_002863 [Batrachochytrium dendrobatidis]KAK5668843.1 hypothetical protein QVD99_004625 [Batrachochytrium dendrobatidis]OAJ41758.1 hypothetical protein BDEG_25304 [Batrachochytrium dendrobatidis JEL423]|eukprot:XP_006678663.1 hypothetical protein BATDEDRAFT_88393 [Batrachochytrium dendrobatidis JAM81]